LAFYLQKTITLCVVIGKKPKYKNYFSMNSKAFGLIFLFLSLCSGLVAMAQALPANFITNPLYQTFVNNQRLVKQLQLRLPQSDFLLLYTAIERTEDKEAWSISPADGTVAKIFAYHLKNQSIDAKQTESLNKQLGADRFYFPNFCGGLGSFENWQVETNKIVLTQVYAPASEIIDCKNYIYFDGKNILVSKNLPNVSTGLAGNVAAERNQKNEQALKLLQSQKLNEAIKIWEELYGYIKNGSYATEGKIDEFMNNLGFAYWKAKRYKEAEKVLLECLTRFPKRHILFINLADLYRDMKNTKKAKEFYAKVKTSTLTDKQKKYATTESAKLK
jgi:tetratricopeptide (TPR) repeat protein